MTTKVSGKYVILDIDGTIADVRHRLHHIHGPGKKNWDAFFEGMDRDTPIANIIEYVQKLALEHDILVVTGRPEKYRARTEHWLQGNDVPYKKLYMRKNGDHRPDYEAKGEVLKDVSPRQIVLAIDDRPPVCEMWERHGIKCMKVQSDVESQEVNELYRATPAKPKRQTSRSRTA